MLSERAIRHVKLRLRITKFCGATNTDYDKTTDKIVAPHIYFYFTLMTGLVFGGICFVIIQLIQIYLKLNITTIPEEVDDSFDETNSESMAMHEFATIVIGWGEIGVLLSMMGINVQLMRQGSNIVYLYNEIFDYSRRIRKLLAEKNIQLDRDHLKAERNLDAMIYLFSDLSIVVATFVTITVLHPIEPTHEIIREWLEYDWEWSPALIPFMILIFVASQGGANIIITYGLLVICYTFVSIPVLDDLTVESVHTRTAARTTLNTKFLGKMEDYEICQIYREQRYLNIRLNEILASVFIAFHQVGMLACFSVMLFFFVKFQNVIWDTGPIACAVIISSVLTPLVICIYQSNFFGKLVDTSDGFKDDGLKVVPRKTYFRRFIISCQTFYVEEAHPFFHYHKNTLLEFSAAGLDYAITLMLW